MSTKRFKDFGAGKSTEEFKTDPITFSLHGETFECHPRLQGKVLLQFIELANAEDASSSAAVTRIFFEKVLTADSKVRFDALLESPEKIVTVETLGEIIGWLLEEYSGRPNTPSEA
jgi:hypothetical protein